MQWYEFADTSSIQSIEACFKDLAKLERIEIHTIKLQEAGDIAISGLHNAPFVEGNIIPEKLKSRYRGCNRLLVYLNFLAVYDVKIQGWEHHHYWYDFSLEHKNGVLVFSAAYDNERFIKLSTKSGFTTSVTPYIDQRKL